MNPLLNLPANQRDLQRRVVQWNADEALWRKLEPKRRLRRRMRPELSQRQFRELDLREQAAARPPEDCIGSELSDAIHELMAPPAKPKREIGFHAIGKEATDSGTTKAKRK